MGRLFGFERNLTTHSLFFTPFGVDDCHINKKFQDTQLSRTTYQALAYRGDDASSQGDLQCRDAKVAEIPEM